MYLIFVSDNKSCSVCLAKPVVMMTAMLVFAAMAAVLMAAGYRLGTEVGRESSDAYRAALQRVREQELQDIAAAKREAREHVDALTIKLGQLQAQMMRLEALGNRLSTMAGLTDGEFDFSSLPPQGGPDAGGDHTFAVPDFIAALEGLAQRLEDRQQQMSVLESMLQSRHLQQQVLPEGSPVRTGYVSSGFGLRPDPFHGGHGLHLGMDFAGPVGSHVYAVAAGVVVVAEYRPDFGYVVDINHGNGYVTRYAHNQQLMVSVGEAVKKGQVIAKLGDSGRASGPHVHFEVLHHGKNINPSRFVHVFDSFGVTE